jgi:uncharacterized protein involved in exopolysaccharide biosynthesis
MHRTMPGRTTPPAGRPSAVAPADVSSRLLRRLLETFFRRPVVCLLPLVLLTGVGVFGVLDSRDVYTARGVMTVSDSTLLSNLSEVPTGAAGATWWETPAQTTSRAINELMGTDGFADRVADDAGIGAMVDSGAISLDQVRGWVGTEASGSNLVRVWASTDDPELSARLATATLSTFVTWASEGDLSESTAAETFFAERTETYEGELAAAQDALNGFIAANTTSEDDTIPAAKQTEFDDLQADVTRAEARYSNALQRTEEARLAMEQATSDVKQRLRVLDAPVAPTFAQTTPTRRDAIMTVALYVIAGALFSVGLVVLGTLLDRSIRSADDVRNRLGVEVLAVVPAATRR